MKLKNLKKVLAATLSATMVLGMSVTAFADDPVIDAPIYAFDITDVVVPTTYAVAFNPEGLTVKTGDSTTSTDQVLSKNFGIINKSSKDKIITVQLTVADKNTGDDVVTFVNSADDVDNAEDGEYKIHLTVIPADATEVKVGATPASATHTTTAADLNSVTMTKAADSEGEEVAVTLTAGVNKIGFKLEKAVYSPKSGSEVTLGTTTDNDVKNNYEITALAAAGKGITAFTFGGEINTNTEWTKITQGITITPVYTSVNAPTTTTAVADTGAMVKLEAAPSITTADFAILEAGTAANINVDLGVGDLAATKVTAIEWNGKNYLGSGYTYANGVVTISAASVDYFLSTASKSATLKIVFDDTAKTGKTVTLTAKPAASEDDTE